MKIEAYWDVMPCQLVKVTDSSKEGRATIFRDDQPKFFAQFTAHFI
jgi:hypothetical protein